MLAEGRDLTTRLWRRGVNQTRRGSTHLSQEGGAMPGHSHSSRLPLPFALAFAALLAGLLAAGTAAAQDKPQAQPGDNEAVPLHWRFVPGKAFYQEVTYEVAQTMKVQAMEVKQRQSQTLWSRWEPLKKVDGKWTLRQTLLSAKMIDLNRPIVSFIGPTPPDPIRQALDQLRGASFVVTLGRDGRLEKVEGVETFLKRAFRGKPWEGKESMQAILSGSFTMATTTTFPIGPADRRKIKRGESWTREAALDMGPVGKWAVTSRYTYQGRDCACDKIAVETTLKHEPPAADAATTLRLKEVRLRRAGGPGVLLFDGTRGRLVRSVVEIGIEGTFTVEIGGVDTKIELSQRQMTTVKITDTNPLK
jgi:hypothetical protein